MASLVWRRSYPLTYNVNTEVKITPAEYTALSKKEQDNYSRVILSNEDIATLINTATNLQTHAIQLNQERRWWLPTMIGISTAVVAVFLLL